MAADFSRGLSVDITVHNGHPEDSDERVGLAVDVHVPADRARAAWWHILHALEDLFDHRHQEEREA